MRHARATDNPACPRRTARTPRSVRGSSPDLAQLRHAADAVLDAGLPVVLRVLLVQCVIEFGAGHRPGGCRLVVIEHVVLLLTRVRLREVGEPDQRSGCLTEPALCRHGHPRHRVLPRRIVLVFLGLIGDEEDHAGGRQEHRQQTNRRRRPLPAATGPAFGHRRQDEQPHGDQKPGRPEGDRVRGGVIGSAAAQIMSNV